MVAPVVAALIKSLIGAGLGTLAGAVAQKGQEFVEEKLGVDIAASIATPDGLYKLKQLELDHEEDLLRWAVENRKLDLSFYEAEVKDRDSARSAHVAIATNKDTPWYDPNKLMVPVLAIGTVGFCLYGIVFTPAGAEVKMALSTIAGVVLSYFFGSSSIAWKQAGRIGDKGEKQ